MSPAAGCQILQRWCSAERRRVAVIGLDIPDGMGPRRRLRKTVRRVVRAQRGPGNQREKQGQSTNDRRGVFSPPSHGTTAPVHRQKVYKTRHQQERSLGNEIAARYLAFLCVAAMTPMPGSPHELARSDSVSWVE